MGKRTAEVERELSLQREAIARRFEKLRGRVADNADNAREQLAGRTRAIGERLDGMAGPDSVPARHPEATVAGALAAGVALNVRSRTQSSCVARQRLRSAQWRE